mmetsp:Transcript_11322/g.17513  ORF Transcript_11322/g.17513 Transcript_11322/m.17513 type:complete len:355 (-) Transcript_11322:24-1088(-)
MEEGSHHKRIADTLNESFVRLSQPFRSIGEKREAIENRRQNSTCENGDGTETNARRTLSELGSEILQAREKFKAVQMRHEIRLADAHVRFTQDELSKLKSKNLEDAYNHEKDIKESELRLLGLNKQYDHLRLEFDEESSLYPYAASLQDPTNTPNYILVLQAKLCRAVHRMCLMEQHLKMLNSVCMQEIETVEVALNDEVTAGERVEKDLVEIVTDAHEEVYENLDAFSGACRNNYMELVQLERNLAQQKEMDRLFRMNQEMDQKLNANSNSGKKSSSSSGGDSAEEDEDLDGAHQDSSYESFSRKERKRSPKIGEIGRTVWNKEKEGLGIIAQESPAMEYLKSSGFDDNDLTE